MGKNSYLSRKLLRFYAKIVREQADAGYIARGWAIGMFCGCFFPFGIQLFISIPTAFILRGSKIGATVGTLLTNHVSIFFIYPLQCYVGNRLMGGDLSWEQIKNAMAEVLVEQSFESLFHLGWRLTLAFFIGGALLTAVMTPLTYFGVKKFVLKRQQRKMRKMVDPR